VTNTGNINRVRGSDKLHTSPGEPMHIWRSIRIREANPSKVLLPGLFPDRDSISSVMFLGPSALGPEIGATQEWVGSQ
jgi:hypothetical protein